MFANPLNQIKNSVRSSFASLSPRSGESIITYPYTGNMTILDGSNVVIRILAPAKIPATKASNFSPKKFDFSSSSLDTSEQESPLLGASSSYEKISTTPFFPNSRLFRGSQDEFGFDVYIPAHYEDHCAPAYLFECPVILPWDQLVVALANESGREPKGVVLASKFCPCVVHDNVSYQAWLEWSRKNDGPCSTDLWLTT